MSFSVTILGSSSAVPTKDRNQTCQLLTHSDCDYLIDAGEGVQKQLLINKARWSKLRAVFISHLHPDHYIGLIGLVCSLGLRGRTNKLVVVAPLGLEEIINIQLKNGDVHLGYELEFITTNVNSELIYSDQKISVSTVKLTHRIDCFGYVFTELPKPRKLLIEKVKEHHIPVEFYHDLKHGLDVEINGKKWLSKEFTELTEPPFSYAYCTDTRPVLSKNSPLHNCTVLYHDSTFAEDLVEKAFNTYHSTNVQAAELAKYYNVHQLILGHFSSRYVELQPLLHQAKAVFENTVLGIEGTTFQISNH